MQVLKSQLIAFKVVEVCDGEGVLSLGGAVGSVKWFEGCPQEDPDHAFAFFSSLRNLAGECAGLAGHIAAASDDLTHIVEQLRDWRARGELRCCEDVATVVPFDSLVVE